MAGKTWEGGGLSSCEIDWTLWPDWISALATAGTFGVAIWAAVSWRQQLRGGSKYVVSQDIATAARSLKYAFYGTRSPLIEGWEFPETYWQSGIGSKRSNSEEADAYRHVYHRRMKELWPSIKAVADMRSKAGAILGEEVARNVEDLAKKARELDFYFQQDVDQRRAGPEGVKQWTDQDFVTRVKKSVVAENPPDDKFSKEFEEIFDRLLIRLRPHL